MVATEQKSSLIPVGIQNPRIQQYLSIKQNTKSNPGNLVCLEGMWELTKALEAGLELRAFFVCFELLRGNAGHSLAGTIVDGGVPSYEVSARVMRRMVDRDEPDGLAAMAHLRRAAWDDIVLRDQNRLVVLDGLEIPGNIGTIIRSADSTGADGVVITNRRTRLTHPKLIHASMGSSFSIPVIEADMEDAIAWLKRHDFRIFKTDTRAPISYREASYAGRVAIVLGSERYGIMKAWYDAQDVNVSIPMAGTADSLNVGNAAVILLYEAFYQQEPSRF
jgi:TrmH family RNA methyltransferase